MDRGISALSPGTPQPSPTPMGSGPQTVLGYGDYLLGNEKKYSNFHFRIEAKATISALEFDHPFCDSTATDTSPTYSQEHRVHKTLA